MRRAPCAALVSGSRSSTAATITCSSRCSIKSRWPRCRPATSRRRFAGSCAGSRTSEVLLAEVRAIDQSRGSCPRSADGEIVLRLPDRRERRDARLLRARRVARDGAGSEDARGCARHPPARAAGVRARRARDRSGRARAAAHLRRHRRRPDRRRDGRRAGRDLAAVARPRLPALRSELGAHHPARGRAVRAQRRFPSRCARRRAPISCVSASTFGPVRRSPTWRRGHVDVGAEIIAAETVIWAAGVAASPLGATLGAPLDRAGRVLIEPDLTIPGSRTVFVIGDLASLKGADGKPLPGVAQVAIQMGKHAARNILRADRAAALPAVRLQGSRQHGDDRPRVGRRRFRLDAAEGISRLAGVAVRPHPQPDRLPQPARRHGAVGVVVLQLPARHPADHRTHAGRRTPTSSESARRAIRK